MVDRIQDILLGFPPEINMSTKHSIQSSDELTLITHFMIRLARTYHVFCQSLCAGKFDPHVANVETQRESTKY